MASPVLLDTCAAIWLANGDAMTEQSRTAVDAAHAARVGIFVSPISAWEIATLVAKNRLRLTLEPGAWFAALLALPGIRLADMGPTVLIASAFLPSQPPRDPADRVIAATARSFGWTVVTRDNELLAYAQAGHIEAAAC